MCAVCGCLEARKPAPEAGSYVCVECEKTGKVEKVEVKAGQAMPDCSACGGKAHWKKG
jgi:hypothetical protein